MWINPFKENIILPSLNFIKNDSKVKKFYFLPWLISIIFLTLILLYQSIYTYVKILEKEDRALEIILKVFHSSYSTEIIVTTIILFICYIIITPIFEWGLIKYIHDKTQKEDVSCADTIWFWIVRFTKLFEYNNIFSEFKFISILNWYLFSIRFFGVIYLKYITLTFIVLFLLSTVLNIFIAYAKYEIILNNKWVFKAIWISSKIALLNLKTTIKLYFLKFLLNIRVILNFIIFLSFPVLFILMFGFITSKIFLVIWMIILSLIFIWFILFLWYITAVLEIFTTSVRYFAYRQWKKKLDELNDDDENKD